MIIGHFVDKYLQEEKTPKRETTMGNGSLSQILELKDKLWEKQANKPIQKFPTAIETSYEFIYHEIGPKWD